ncbi:MAG: hypothetical protein CMM02_20935 [Rhodopirellula sp.]|nr:hypothetical protein [Rhodopirellula sp.]|tara:strand:- start:6572 stop:7018 length:447 start_codon:yes stop_codon:yes gene_type:complete
MRVLIKLSLLLYFFNNIYCYTIQSNKNLLYNSINILKCSIKNKRWEPPEGYIPDRFKNKKNKELDGYISNSLKKKWEPPEGYIPNSLKNKIIIEDINKKIEKIPDKETLYTNMCKYTENINKETEIINKSINNIKKNIDKINILSLDV